VSEKDQYGNVNLTFHTLYDDTIPEDQRFALATPEGQEKFKKYLKNMNADLFR